MPVISTHSPIIPRPVCAVKRIIPRQLRACSFPDPDSWLCPCFCPLTWHAVRNSQVRYYTRNPFGRHDVKLYSTLRLQREWCGGEGRGERKREGEKDRQTDKQIESERDRQTDRQADRQRERERGAYRQTHRQTDRQTVIERQRQTDRQTETERVSFINTQQPDERTTNKPKPDTKNTP